MAGGNFIARALSYVVNEFVVESLANSRAFQRFAVKTSKAIENVTSKAVETRESVIEQMKEATDRFDPTKRY